MTEPTKYFVVTKKAVPEVLLKVVEAKYKDDIFPFHDSTQGKTVTLSMQIEDEPGLLSDVLQVIAQFGANILTIHQSIPINGVAALSISVQVLQTTKDISEMLDAMEKRTGVHSVKILAKE